jgi:hypothetical protein
VGRHKPSDRSRFTPNAAGPLPIVASAVRDLERELLASLHMKAADTSTYTSNYTSSDSDRSAARVAVFFSGSLDCALLARLTNDLLPVGESIDLLNVAFYTHALSALIFIPSFTLTQAVPGQNLRSLKLP